MDTLDAPTAYDDRIARPRGWIVKVNCHRLVRRSTRLIAPDGSSRLYSLHAVREGLGRTVPGDEGDQATIRRKECTRLPDWREADHIRRRGEGSSAICERTSEVPR